MRKIISIGSALFLLLSVSGCAAPDSDSADPQQNAAETEAESQRATESPSEDADAIKQEVATMRISVKSEEYEIIYELNDSKAARELYAQLPLTTEVEPFSNNEMTFYPEKLDVADAPFSDGEPGSLSYYAPWGDVVMFYDHFGKGSNLYELGTVISGEEFIEALSGSVLITGENETAQE